MREKRAVQAKNPPEIMGMSPEIQPHHSFSLRASIMLGA
jgi:hypothetical protein